jgi:hypothetical protein
MEDLLQSSTLFLKGGSDSNEQNKEPIGELLLMNDGLKREISLLYRKMKEMKIERDKY